MDRPDGELDQHELAQSTCTLTRVARDKLELRSDPSNLARHHPDLALARTVLTRR